MRVIVVGAGIAGLAAADALRRDAADVTVLEARERIGGRTWTVPLGPGLVDLGASWIHGPVGNPVAEAARSVRVPLSNDGPWGSRMAVWADGWAEPALASTAAAVRADWDPGEALRATGSDRFDDGVEWYLDDRGLDGETAAIGAFVLRRFEAELAIAAPAGDISLAGAAAYREGTGGNLVPAGGMASLVSPMAAGLDIRTGARATLIEHGPDGAAVWVRDERIGADRVVLTVPLGVLGSIELDPPLPAGHAGALGRLRMGTLEKIVLRFPRRFWPASARRIARISDDGAFPAWADFSRHVGAPTLVALYNPGSNPRIDRLPAAGRVPAAMDALRTMFGTVPDPVEVAVTDWRSDPFARGSYSFVPAGSGPGDPVALARPVSDRLALAGEATVAEAYGTVHGAFRSGLRAARWALGGIPVSTAFGPAPDTWST